MTLINKPILLLVLSVFLGTLNLYSQADLIKDITIPVGESKTYNDEFENVETRGSVVVSGDGTNGGTLTINARKSITLKPGFSAVEGSKFKATIEPHMILGSDYDMNWTQVVSYDENGKPVSWAKSFVDELGRPLQSQSFSFQNYQAYVSQSVYDDLGRSTITSMAVPVTQDKLKYLPNFIKNSSNQKFNLDTDEAVAKGENQLGWYYSGNNPEAYVDHTDIPYSRVEYSKTQPGAVRKSASPGAAHKMGSGHEVQSYVLPASENELKKFLSLDPDVEYKEITKTVKVDPDGKYVVSYTNRDGKPIANCLVGVVGDVNPFGGSPNKGDFTCAHSSYLEYVDVFVPTGGAIQMVSGQISPIQDPFQTQLPLGNRNYTYTVINLTNDVIVKSSIKDLEKWNTSGFYRVICNDKKNDFKVFVRTNYCNYSLNIYDKAGRLKKTYSPYATENNDPSYCTKYTYNSLGWLTKVESKDEGISHFVYREDGQILFSQNAQQKIDEKFSYSMYDEYGRLIESGEYDESIGRLSFWNGESIALSKDDELSSHLRDMPSIALTQRHKTWYGEDGNEQNQTFVLGSVSKTEYDENITYYSYTYDGKIDWIIRDHIYLGRKKIDYIFDFVGKIIKVAYQEGAKDQFIHYFEYNKDQNLHKVYTQRGSRTKQLQAEYTYYPHQAIKRIEIAENLQGIDYVYNLNGMIKCINHPNLDKNLDPGKDGTNGFREDLFGLALDYYSGDYAGNINIKTANDITSSYSGNIAMVRWNQYNNKASSGGQWAYKVAYDNRNFLKEAVFGIFTHANSVFTGKEDYKVSNITYDTHGNIQTLKRNGYGTYRDMDKLQYHYASSNINRLSHISDTYGSIGLQDLSSQSIDNYQYNSIGQMTYNAADDIRFRYDVTGKVSSFTKAGKLGKYDYDDSGFRCTVRSINGENTYYIRDMSGNIMAIYNQQGNVLEYPIYGNDRIGMAFEKGSDLVYNYELKDHLGNVRSTFSKSDLVDATGYADYYPFGWKMPNRMADAANKYRFGYQGQFSEYDDETGLNQFEARLYDNRIGRWLTTDPLAQFASPYLAMGNTPFMGIDPDGRLFGKYLAKSYAKLKGGTAWRGQNGKWFASITSSGYMNGEATAMAKVKNFGYQGWGKFDITGNLGFDVRIGESYKMGDFSLLSISLTTFHMADVNFVARFNRDDLLPNFKLADDTYFFGFGSKKYNYTDKAQISAPEFRILGFGYTGPKFKHALGEYSIGYEIAEATHSFMAPFNKKGLNGKTSTDGKSGFYREKGAILIINTGLYFNTYE